MDDERKKVRRLVGGAGLGKAFVENLCPRAETTMLVTEGVPYSSDTPFAGIFGGILFLIGRNIQRQIKALLELARPHFGVRAARNQLLLDQRTCRAVQIDALDAGIAGQQLDVLRHAAPPARFLKIAGNPIAHGFERQ